MKTKLLKFSTVFLLFVMLFADKAFTASTYTVSVGTGVKINEHGVCRYALNSSAQAAIFISTNTAGEWASFYSNSIPGVSWNSCCGTDYYRSGTSCVHVGTGFYAPANDENRYSCSNKPANSSYTGAGNGGNSCGWSCDSGYTQSGGSCVAAASCPAVSSGGCTFPASGAGNRNGNCNSGITCEAFRTCQSNGTWANDTVCVCRTASTVCP